MHRSFQALWPRFIAIPTNQGTEQQADRDHLPQPTSTAGSAAKNVRRAERYNAVRHCRAR
jgi:hypothetical protein